MISQQQNISSKLFNQAKEIIPGGVNSPVRSFKSVGGNPIFVKRGKGSKIYSEDGKKLIDYCLSWGALILGHAHKNIITNLKSTISKGTSFGMNTKQEIELAYLIREAIPSIKQSRLVSSGTEAVMSAIRLARAYTNKNKIIKFAGSYHGHVDYLLVKGGSGLSTLGIPNSLGLVKDFIKHTLVLPFNDIHSIENVITKHSKDLAAVIIEPVAANCGVILPDINFLKALRRLTRKYGIVLIFDEVITGFRLLYGGAQNLFKVTPDLTCLGKIIGGGLPIGAFGGAKDIMKLLAPEGGVYQAGTLSGNPISVAAGITTLKTLKENNPYEKLADKTKQLCTGFKTMARNIGLDICVNYIGSMFSVFFTDLEIRNYKLAKKQDIRLFNKLFHGLLAEGVYFSPSGFESNFLSVSHSERDIERTLKAFNRIIGKIGRV